jgi:hypothetical protein
MEPQLGLLKTEDSNQNVGWNSAKKKTPSLFEFHPIPHVLPTPMCLPRDLYLCIPEGDLVDYTKATQEIS